MSEGSSRTDTVALDRASDPLKPLSAPASALPEPTTSTSSTPSIEYKSVSAFELYKEYDAAWRHEDMLIGQRQGWFLANQGFLLAATGVLVAKVFDLWYARDAPEVLAG